MSESMSTATLPNRQPWLHSAPFDLTFIIGPAFVVTAIVLALRPWWLQVETLPVWLWVLLIIGVDVSHVYSTLFRTYFDRAELAARRGLYLGAPLLLWAAGVLLYSFGSDVFWRVLAYLAVFHFVRQQYGFMMMYARDDGVRSVWSRRLDQWAIYSATLYPLVYWHCHERNFSWSVAGDFAHLAAVWPERITALVYAVVMLAYVAREIFSVRAGHSFNWPRNLLLFGTALSWYVGIVATNNDLAFTATNVIAHGIPYMALIWLYGRNRVALAERSIQSQPTAPFVWPPLQRLFSWRYVPIFCATLFALAYAEEVLWDGFIWREHGAVLLLAASLPTAHSGSVLNWLVPLLALPQATHYVLDAYIWRLREPGTIWKEVLFSVVRQPPSSLGTQKLSP